MGACGGLWGAYGGLWGPCGEQGELTVPFCVPESAAETGCQPVVILLGWAGCQDRYLAKYSAIYSQKVSGSPPRLCSHPGEIPASCSRGETALNGPVWGCWEVRVGSGCH